MLLQRLVNYCTEVFAGLGLPMIEVITQQPIESETVETPADSLGPAFEQAECSECDQCSESTQARHVRSSPEYVTGHRYYRRGMVIACIDDCPHSTGDRRHAWMLGFVDAYCQAIYTRNGLGSWLLDDLSRPSRN